MLGLVSPLGVRVRVRVRVRVGVRVRVRVRVGVQSGMEGTGDILHLPH